MDEHKPVKRNSIGRPHRIYERPRHAFGKAKLAEATKLYEQAASCEPADVMEWLDVELAKSEIAA